MVENSQIESSFAEIRKRNGDTTKFDQDKITNAIYKALLATSEGDRDLAQNLTNGVLNKLSSQGFGTENPPSVEDIQDMVESTLIEQGHSEIAKSYILYRHERRKIRDEKMGELVERMKSMGFMDSFYAESKEAEGVYLVLFAKTKCEELFNLYVSGTPDGDEMEEKKQAAMTQFPNDQP